jgi:hypothetical protein
MGEGEPVTVIVHGTFASDEPWWKPGKALPPSAADDLEKALRGHGMTGSVWRGLRDDPPAVIDTDDPDGEVTAIEAAFGWSGRNRHRDRVRAAEQIRGSLESLADRSRAVDGTGAREPLGVHVVAHSHGGNVVLEMMNNPPSDVDIRSITMLGTPLIWTFPAYRLIRILLALLFAASLVFVMIPPPGESVAKSVAISGFFMLAYPWAFFWARRLFVLPIRAVAVVWRRLVHGGRPPGRPAYGPRPDVLREELGREILLLRSAEDEADLMMHFGASPTEAYKSLVRPTRPTRAKVREGGVLSYLGFGTLWFFEMLIIRPWVYILMVPIFEAGVEHIGLGFPWRTSMWRNQEMVSQRDRRRELYPANALTRLDVTAQLLPTLEREIRERATTAVYVGETPTATVVSEDGIRTEQEHLDELKATFGKLVRSFKEQFNLRHSMYYESPEIIEMVAQEIAAAERGEPSPNVAPKRQSAVA